MHKQLLTCHNKCHRTKLRPIIQLKRFLRATYNGNLHTLTRGSMWLAALCHGWSGILQPSLCLGLHGAGSTSAGRTTCAPVNKYRLPFQTPTSKRCLRLLGKKSWVTSLQLYSSAANFAISKSTCNYSHPSIKAGGWKKKKGCVLISQALRREMGIFQESRNQRTRGLENFWPSFLLICICIHTYIHMQVVHHGFKR